MNRELDRPDTVRDEITCEACGEKGVQVGSHMQTFTYGEGPDAVDLTTIVPVYSCPQCGLQYTDDEAERIRHEAVCEHLGRLPPAAIQGIRKGYGLSREQFSEITGIGVASLARWENGNLIQSAAYDRYLRLLADTNIFDRVRAASRGDAPEITSATPVVRRFPSLDRTRRTEVMKQRFQIQVG